MTAATGSCKAAVENRWTRPLSTILPSLSRAANARENPHPRPPLPVLLGRLLMRVGQQMTVSSGFLLGRSGSRTDDRYGRAARSTCR